MDNSLQGEFFTDITASSLIGAVSRQALADIEMITKRITEARRPSDIFAWIDQDRLRHDDVRDVCISAAVTASLTAFLRPGEPWRLECADQNSEAGSMICSALYALRAAVFNKASMISRVRSRCPRADDDVIRSIYILALAVDAVPRHLIQEFSILALHHATNDAQGDAQLLAEEIALKDFL